MGTDGQNGLHTHFARQRNICDRVAFIVNEPLNPELRHIVKQGSLYVSLALRIKDRNLFFMNSPVNVAFFFILFFSLFTVENFCCEKVLSVLNVTLRLFNFIMM